MHWRMWRELPDWMRVEAVRPYYEQLSRKQWQLWIKRGFDVTGAVMLLTLLVPLFLLLTAAVLLDSDGPAFYRQVRVTQYGKRFWILKFRTMRSETDEDGTAVTARGDKRITRTGRFLRKYRLDELPQLFNILAGDMSFVGTRPEAARYVRMYQEEWRATLLLPAGLTSETTLAFADEETMLAEGMKSKRTAEQVYVEELLPLKMKNNILELERFGLLSDLRILIKTIGRTVL